MIKVLEKHEESENLARAPGKVGLATINDMVLMLSLKKQSEAMKKPVKKGGILNIHFGQNYKLIRYFVSSVINSFSPCKTHPTNSSNINIT